MILVRPPAKAVAVAIMPAKAASVSTSSRQARVAAIETGLPASVPPTPPMSTRSRSSRPASSAASASDSPYAPTGMPPPIALPMVTTSGVSRQAAVAPPGPAEKVCVSSLIR